MARGPSIMPEPSTPPEPCLAAAPERRVFVYGTLRRGGSNDIRRFGPPPARHVADGVVDGVLYDLGAYPGLVLGGGGPVRGEVHAVTAELERQLDRLEEVREDDDGEYRRRRVAVRTEAGGTLDCLVYEIHPSRIAGRPVIGGGDWLAHVADRRPPAV